MGQIYKIENLLNEKVYIGSTKNGIYRFSAHKSHLIRNTHPNKDLQMDWNKYGEENFKFEIIEECEKDKLTEREQYWIDYYGGMNNLINYNCREANNNGKMSDISKNRLSISKKGGIPWNKGLNKDIDSRLLVFCKPCSDKVKKRISECNKGHKPWIAGKHHTEETKQKMRKPKSLEAIENMKKAQQNRVWINNGIINKKIKKDELDKYLTEGFVLGVLVKNIQA